MGEVYRARDTKLDRDVAVKVLPEEFAEDEERLARFEREAKLLASLNHPNIASIHGFEDSDGLNALVLELVEGPTLAERIQQGPLPVDETIAIAKQIAEALEAGHEAGIIHRDLKPANIKVTEDGAVKVLDYGLAKALEGDSSSQDDSELSQSPTLTRQGTQIGVILGTAAYMSPEQAKGKRVDKRTDIWAFGAVVYEMLTGNRAFAGEDVSDTLAAVLRAEPDWEVLPAQLSPTLLTFLARCLEKDRSQRTRDAGDLRLAIDGAFDVPVSQPGETERASTQRRPLVMSLVALVALSVGLLLGRASQPESSARTNPRERTRLALNLVNGYYLSGGTELEKLVPHALLRPSRRSFSWSPDGRTLVYAASDGDTTRLFRRSLGRELATSIAGTEGAHVPFVAPDGADIGFFVGTELKRVSLDSGEVRTITTSGAKPEPRRGASWSVDDTILVASGNGIYQVPASGGEMRRLTGDDPAHREPLAFPELLPDGRAVLFNIVVGTVASEWDIAVESLDTGERRVVIEGGSDPRYVSSGHILFLRAGSLMAIPFDIERRETTGSPIRVLEDVMHAAQGPNGNLDTGAGQFSVSSSGELAYVPGGIYPPVDSKLAWVDRTGASELLPLPGSGPYYNPRFSPDGTRLAYVSGSRGNVQIWMYDIELQTPVRLTSTGENYPPIWSPDGSRVAFRSVSEGRYQLMSLKADGSEEPQSMTRDDVSGHPTSWSRDGVLAFFTGSVSHRDIWTLSTNDDGLPKAFLATPADETAAAFSPNGRWLAYISDETGRFEVYVRPFPEGTPVYRVSTAGGGAPAWSRDGRELYYRSSGEQRATGVMVVDVTSDPDFTRGKPRALFDAEFETSVPRSYDMSPEGDRFVMRTISQAEPQPVTEIQVVLNWLDELKRLVPTED